MTHYGYIGHRSMGTPELRPTDYDVDTDRCDDCGQQAMLLDLEHDEQETGNWRCAECQENQP